MAKIRTLQSSLNSGEISERLLGRPDIPRYQQGLEKLRNALPLVIGGATRRPGTRFAAPAMSANSWLIDMSLTIDGQQVGYVIELGNLVMRFYSGSGQVKVDGDPYELETPYTTAELQELSYGQFEDALYLAHPNHHPKRLKPNADFSEWILEDVPFTHYGYLRPENTEDIILTPSAVDGEDITLISNLDYFVPEHVGIRFNVNGGIIEVKTVVDPKNTTAKVLNRIMPNKKRKLICDTVTVTANPATMAAGSTKVITITAQSNRENETLTTTYTNTPPAGFTITRESEPNKDTVTVTIVQADLAGISSVNIQTLIDRMGPDSRLTTTVAPSPRPAGVTVVTVRTKDKLRGTEPDTDWLEQAWSVRLGWPAVVAFHEQRMLLAYTRIYPTNIWGSSIGEILDFNLGTADDDAFSFTAAAASTPVLHLVSAETLLCMTANREISLKSANGPITPTNIDIKARTHHGCKRRVRPVVAGSEILFVTPTGKRLRSFRFKLDKNEYGAPDYALFAEHLLESGGIRQMAYAAEPFSAVWAVTEDGQLLAYVTDQDQDVQGWALQDDPDGLTRYRSVAVTPDANGQGQVWLLVERLVNEVWTPIIEVMDEALLLDSAITGSDEDGSTTWSGLDHLEGREVAIMADGRYVSGKVVTGGAVELDYPAKEVAVGLKYRSVFKDLPVGTVLSSGTAVGAVAGINEVRVRFHRTQGATINGEAVAFRDEWGDALMGPPPVFSGEKVMTELGWGSTPETTQVEIVADEPYPCTVLSIVKKVSIND